MRIRRLARGLLPPVALLVLVGTLGTLQYRWLGRVSEAEREQLRASLDRRAKEFADDFDREITRLYLGLQPGAPLDLAKPDAFTQKYEQWLSVTAAPAMVKSVYYAKSTPPGFSLYRYDARAHTFSPVDWPAPLDVVKRRLTGTVEDTPAKGSAGPGKIIAFSTSTVVAEV